LSAAGPTTGSIVRVSDSKPPSKIAFIHCVGSRDETVGNPSCSAVCCMASLKAAQLIKDKLPDTSMTIYYTDIRAAGDGWEEYYRRARDWGIKFVRGRPSYVEETENNRLIVHLENTLTGEQEADTYDMVVLSIGLRPNEGADKIAALLNLGKRPTGFLTQAHPKIKPAESHIAGVFLAGCATGPKDIPHTISQAGAAATKALGLVSRGEVLIDPIKAVVDASKCTGCRLCERVCAYGSIKMEDKIAKVFEISCTGCGSCSVVCPEDAIQIRAFTNEQIEAEIDACLEKKSEYPTIVAFLCNWCSYAAADLAGVSRFQYPSNVRIIRIMCSCRSDPKHVVRALRKGADGVLVIGCRLGECHYKDGNYLAKTRMEVLKEVLAEQGIDERRVRVNWLSASEYDVLGDTVRNFVKEIKEIGPIGSEIRKVTEEKTEISQAAK
ncbi:MAG: hydrogenase iron-sulfur subunit, partial [Candidatus Bathyarchaeota archaeon]